MDTKGQKIQRDTEHKETQNVKKHLIQIHKTQGDTVNTQDTEHNDETKENRATQQQNKEHI